MTADLLALLGHLEGDSCAQCVTGRDSLHPPNTSVRVFRPAERSSTQPDPETQAALRASLGVELRALRAEFGLSQKALAVRAGVARSSVERLEAGQRRPTASMLAALVLAAGWASPAASGRSHAVSVGWFVRLVSAAGPNLVVDTEAGVRRRGRRLVAARRAERARQVRSRRQLAVAEAERRRAFMAGVRRLARARSADAIGRAMAGLGW